MLVFWVFTYSKAPENMGKGRCTTDLIGRTQPNIRSPCFLSVLMKTYLFHLHQYKLTAVSYSNIVIAVKYENKKS